MPFPTEAELVQTALASPYFNDLVGNWPETVLIEEPKGLFGIPDVVIAKIGGHAVDGFLSFAFEMKLSHWKRALMQAYRYKSFANLSYVMLDEQFVRPALKNLDMFQRSNIGLLSISSCGHVEVYFDPSLDQPYSDYVEDNFRELILSYPKRIERKPRQSTWNTTQNMMDCINHSYNPFVCFNR